MKLNLIFISFVTLTILPQAVKAESLDIKQCVQSIKTHWLSNSDLTLEGQARMGSPCELKMAVAGSAFKVQAQGAPLEVNFELAPSQGEITRFLQSCRVDNEKIHVVFEERTSSDFEKRDRVQMTLLKRHGQGLSLILSKRENKILRPLQQSSLICHLND